MLYSSPLSFALPSVLLGSGREFRGTTANEVTFTVRAAASQTANVFVVEDSNGTNLLTVNNDGDVTITGDLTVSGNTNITIDQAITGNLTLTGNLTVNGNSVLGNVSTDTTTVTGDLTMVSGQILLDNANDLSNPDLTFAGDTNTGMYSPVPDAIAFVTANAERLRISNTEITFGASIDLGLGDDASLVFGDGDDAAITWNTSQTVDGWYFGTATGQNTLIIAERGDESFDFAHGARTNPTVFIHSAAQNTAQWLSLSHDGTDGVINVGTGALAIASGLLELNNFIRWDTGQTAPAGSVYYIGRDTALTAMHHNAPSGAFHAFSTNNTDFLYMTAAALYPFTNDGKTLGLNNTNQWSDLYLANGGVIGWNNLDVALTHSTNTLAFSGGAFRINDDQLITFGTSDDAAFYYNLSQTPHSMWFSVGQDSRAIIIAEGTDRLTDFAHAQQTNPTVFIHSADATDLSDFGSLAHNQTRFVIGSGRGGVGIVPTAETSGTPKTLLITGAAHTGLTASTEVVGVDIDVDATKQWATGALTLQREVFVRAPTYAFAGASILTLAATMAVEAGPKAGSNATLSVSTGFLVGSSTTVSADAYANLSIIPNGITDGVGNVNTWYGFQYTSGVNVSLGNQTATLAELAAIDIDAVTFESTTLTRTVTLAAGMIINAPVAGTNVTFNAVHGLVVESGTSRFDDKVIFTQADGNEYIDSEADGYLDYSVTTAHRFRMSSSDTDVRLEFIGTTSSGLLEWMEDEDYFRFGDSVLFNAGSVQTAAGVDVNMSAGGRLYGGGFQLNTQTLAADTNLTLDENDGLVLVTLGSTSDNTITLPPAAGNEGMIIEVYITNGAGSNNAVVTAAGADTIANGFADTGNTTVTLGDTADFVTLRCVNNGGTNDEWNIIAQSGVTVA